ncbi:Oidioi.mRNA.OKI2018_I69.chr2.g4151.t1.cds [Oikopleura dioica]|uniref:Oidioi.mRNA.OKI2018_I69.chr2.g4151.t1.cds n=1 Tax=Oikopleura dioica TaxID=34765 RepID=A0ABN7SWW6_OIKDI|nr:Oidioi.mRNA.OKI2018_I69.chr2.g4151.t1.cds [Oikopleura dioica]
MSVSIQEILIMDINVMRVKFARIQLEASGYLVGSYTCNCTANMELDFDLDEGKAKCVCKEGFERFNNSATECVDKDECLNPIEDDYNKCHKTQLCENTLGSFDCYCSESMEKQIGHDSCKCKEGHEPIEDLPNECKMLLEPCAAGEYRIDGSTICRPCEYGHFCQEDEKFPCERGFFADKSGSTICTYCGTGATTKNTGSTKRRDCIIGSYGFFSPLFNVEPMACQFQSFCPKGLQEMTPFYHNHKGANICLKSETKMAVGKMKLRKAPVPPVYDAEPENFCYRVCRGKPKCVAFSILLEDKIFCVLISS